MMKALVVYDSAFGNTEKIAKAVGEVLGSSVVRAGEVKPEDLNELDMLIVGSPTQAFQPLQSIKTFIKHLGHDELKGVKTAAFDTRVDTKQIQNRLLSVLVKVFGYAAKPIASQLAKKGGVNVSEPQGFFVNDKEGPLKDGELERAAAWAKSLLS